MKHDPEEFLAAAAEIADRWPGPAALLRRHAAPVENPDPLKFRRMVLQRIWRTHFFGMNRLPAASQIATKWIAWTQSGGDDLPGSIGEAFARLERAGVTRIAYRTIAKDLAAKVD